MTNTERRFAGRMTEEYRLVKQAYPHFELLQQAVAQAVTRHAESREGPLPILEIGCGDGITSDLLLRSSNRVNLTALDNEEEMVERARQHLQEWTGTGRLSIVHADALAYLRQCADDAFGAVASAMTLHNLVQSYRKEVLQETLRVLQPGGLFVNADKYAPDGQARFDALVTQIGRFFDAFVPQQKYDLLKDWVMHNVADQGPERAMTEKQAVADMLAMGWTEVIVGQRHNMEAVLTAYKPGA